MADTEKKESKKKSGFFQKAPVLAAKWFREMRSELKKVSWPTFEQVLNNSGVVLVSILLVGVIVGAFDWVWGKIVEAIIHL